MKTSAIMKMNYYPSAKQRNIRKIWKTNKADQNKQQKMKIHQEFQDDDDWTSEDWRVFFEWCQRRLVD